MLGDVVGTEGVVPRPPSALIGRVDELRQAGQMLAEGRLLTVVGPAGAGKTRLALEVAADHVGDAVFVDLAATEDPAGVVAAIARSLGLGDGGARPLVQTVHAHLREFPALVVLDNFEHLLAAAPEVAGLLAMCPATRVLATSRAALQVPGEWLLPLEPLPVPDLRALPAAAEVAGVAAVVLFAERVRATSPDFVVDDSNSRTVAEICVALDGLPLALELAAAHVRSYGLDEVLARTRSRFDLLSRPRSAVPQRHRSLAAAVRWSVDRLEPETRAAFAELSVFRGTWTADAARVVCGAGAVTALGELVEHSLVGATETGHRMRYRMLETLREWAAALLEESGQASAVRDRHRRWAVTLAEQVGNAFNGPDEAGWLDRADVEHGNLQAALLVSPAGDPAGLRMATDLSWFWDVRGHLVEGRCHLERLLAAPVDDPVVRARALDALGRLAMYQSDHVAAVAALRESAALSMSAGDLGAWAWSTSTVAFSAFMTGRIEEAAEQAEAAVAAGRGTSSVALARALCALGVTQAVRNRPEAAQTAFQECLRDFAPDSGSWARGRTLYFVGWAAYRAGDLDRAERVQRESALILQGIGDRRSVADCLDVLGCAARLRGGPALALRRFSVAAGIRARSGVARHPYLDDEVAAAVVAARAEVGSTAARGWETGGGLTVEDVLEDHGPSHQAVLSPRESEVARLIARGATNRQIGRGLGISERTVERHAENIRAKLGVGSRTQIAAWVASRTVPT